ncbi:hypothetical protein SSX86_029491 [Deinandra increscens subsp. villosa]|uniref:F-box domain-containing protein n=1 Tax=Deinandra increscens subsp. villosa TaxID=3103831 RepID=A0AAP0GKK9_9ASTR
MKRYRSDKRMEDSGIMRMNDDDRLSSLSNDLLHKILSLSSFDIIDLIQLAFLSSRWRFIWTSSPHLDFSTQDFETLPSFSRYVTNVLSRRDNLTDLHSLNLTFRGKTSQAFVKRLLNYAFSHNVQQLNVEYLVQNDAEFPLSLFSSHSLKHLTLTMRYCDYNYHIFDDSNSLYNPRETSFNVTLTSTPDLPTLTTLDLRYITFREGTADKCIGVFANLKNLTLKECKVINGSDGFGISHPRLSNLTLENSFTNTKVVNVAAPQLENLTIKACCPKLVVSAPDLASLVYKGSRPLNLSTDGFRSLKKADICASPYYQDAYRLRDLYAHHSRQQRYIEGKQVVFLLEKLHNVHFLTLNLEIVELLSSFAELLKLHRPSPFVNLKTLKIYPSNEYWSTHQKPFITMSAELKSYLLDGSPKSTFTMVLREEIEAQKIMAELGAFLEKEKDNTKSNNAHLERGKAQMANWHIPKKRKYRGNIMAQIKSYQKNQGVQIEGRGAKVSSIISKLLRMEEILTRLPAAKRAKIQPCFYSLFAEAGIAVSKLTDYIKIQCDENQSCSSVDRRYREYYQQLHIVEAALDVVSEIIRLPLEAVLSNSGKQYHVFCRRLAGLNDEFISHKSPTAGFDLTFGKRIEQKLIDYNQETERFAGYAYEELSEVYKFI